MRDGNDSSRLEVVRMRKINAKMVRRGNPDHIFDNVDTKVLVHHCAQPYASSGQPIEHVRIRRVHDEFDLVLVQLLEFLLVWH